MEVMSYLVVDKYRLKNNTSIGWYKNIIHVRTLKTNSQQLDGARDYIKKMVGKYKPNYANFTY